MIWQINVAEKFVVLDVWLFEIYPGLIVQLTDFYEFLLKNKPNSADHYESGLRAVSKDMLKEGVINKPLEEMTAPELEIAVFNIFHNDFFIKKNTKGKRMYSNSVKQYQCFLKQNAHVEDYESLESEIKYSIDLSETERAQIIKARVGQGIFRDALISKYTNCIVSGISDERLLVASHVKPWAVSDNHERIDVENGLLLSSLYDKMFDIGLITFEDSGKIQISSSVKTSDRIKFGLDEDRCYEIKATDSLRRHLEYHRDMIFIA